MSWWAWLIVVLVVIAVLTGSALYVQARRRSGGVIAATKPGRGSRR